MASEGSPVLAGLIEECYIQGVKHFGEPTGRTITFAGVQTYISEPPARATSSQDKKKKSFYTSQMCSGLYVNAQDYYASYGPSQTTIHGVQLFSGFIVLGIDYFFGDPISLHLDNPDFDRSGRMVKSRKQAKGTFQSGSQGRQRNLWYVENTQL